MTSPKPPAAPGAFDEHHPPSRELIADCVHCGFCLPACPTYLLWNEEMDSPRGRIYLMKTGLEGEPLSPALVRHVDLCLGCMACVTACPSGVQYGKLIEATRQQVERQHPRPLADRLYREVLFRLFPYPGRLRAARLALAVYQRLGIASLLRRTGMHRWLPERLRALESLRPELRPLEEVAALTPAAGRERRRVGLLTGCVQRVFFPNVNAATVRVLAAEGCAILAPEDQGCCGALSLHTGREEEAGAFARRTIDVFDRAGVEQVVVNAAGCGSAMKEYAHLLRDDPAYAQRARSFSSRVRDLSELLQEMGPVAPRHALPVRVAYQDACHLAHAQGIRRPPRQLLADIPGLELREIAEAGICCGSAGVYNLLEPGPACELGRRKALHVLESGAEVLVSTNPGCLLQIRSSLAEMGRPLPVAHLAEVLDVAIGGRGAAALVAGR
jgi:glycolate oxidase iron-sulfur subunit